MGRSPPTTVTLDTKDCLTGGLLLGQTQKDIDVARGPSEEV